MGEIAPRTGGGYKGEAYGNNSGQININSPGIGSAALGPGANAMGLRSIAFGANAFSNQDSIAIGAPATASGQYGISIGNGSSAISTGAIGIGYVASANGFANTVVGYAATGFNNYACIYGSNAGNSDTNQPAGSIAIGYQARVQGKTNGTDVSNIAIGYQSGRAGGGAPNSAGLNIALGYQARFSINSGADSSCDQNIIIGKNAIANVSTFASNLNISNCIILGSDSQASSAIMNTAIDGGIAIGNACSVGANRAIALGNTNGNANVQVASVAIGTHATTENPSQTVFGGGNFVASFPAQSMMGINKLWTQTTTSTQQILGCSSGTTFESLTPTGRLSMARGAYLYDCDIVAKDTANIGVGKAWNLKFLIIRENTAASTALIGTPTTVVYGESSSATSWLVNVVANTTDGRPDITVTGEAGKTIRWVCQAKFTKTGN